MSEKPSKPNKWFLVVGYFMDEDSYACDQTENLRTGSYFTNTAGKAYFSFAHEFASGDPDRIFVKYIIECGSDEPDVSPITNVYGEGESQVVIGHPA